MSRLNLVIADPDESYARGLSGYISSYRSEAFIVSCFTKAESLACHMEQQPTVDILLISPEFYDVSRDYAGIKMKAVLSEGLLSREYPGFQIIGKYCTGEKLLSEIMHLYSKLNPDELRLSSCLKNAVLIGVYSPAGGTGKSTVAAALAIHCAELGMQSFYLNLESVQSTGIYLGSNSKRGLSYIFYYLKEKSGNLSFKMEGIKSSGEGTGVHYFNPPESPMEYGEINACELEQLVQGIKGMGSYDYIFIDMSSSLDMKNLKLMELCDRIILVALQEPVSLYKNRVLFNELAKLNDTDKTGVMDKFITVVNKCGDSSCLSADELSGSTRAICIPEYTRVLQLEDGRLAPEGGGFREAVDRLFRLISVK